MVQGRALSFVSAVIGWDELSCVSVPITSSSEGCGKREVPGRRRGRKVEREMGVLLLPEILISLRRRPLSQYSRNEQHQRGSVWHTGKVILTAGVSLEWTNHCFTWLNRVQERRSREQEQSLISYRVMKVKWLIHWTKILHLYACKWLNTITDPQSEGSKSSLQRIESFEHLGSFALFSVYICLLFCTTVNNDVVALSWNYMFT